ncbi:MAG: hypothetical protein ACPG5B_02945 [Chitinophagales bacterium]
MKPSLRLTFFTILAIIAFVTYFFLWDTDRQLFNAVPDTAILMLEIDDVEQARQKLSETSYWLDFQNMDMVNKLESSFVWLDSLLLKQSLNKHTKIVASLHLTRADDYDYVLLTPTNALTISLNKAIERLDSAGLQIDERQFKGELIYEIKVAGAKRPFTITQAANVLICSSNPVLVDESLNQLNKFSSNGFYKKVWKSNFTATDATLHINFANFPFLASVFLKESQQHESIFTKANDFVHWTQLGLSFDKKALDVQGYADFANTDNMLYTALDEAPFKEELQLPKYLPFNTAMLLHASVDDFASLHKKTNNRHTGTFGKYANDWVGNEWAYGFIEPSGASYVGESFIAMSISDSTVAMRNLQHFVATDGIQPPPIPYNEYWLMQINFKMAANYLFSDKIAAEFEEAYATLIDNNVFITTNINTLKVLIENYSMKKTLNKTSDFQDFLAEKNSDNNLFLYTQTGRFKQLFQKNASVNFLQELAKDFSYYKRITPLAFEFSSGRKGVVTTGKIGYTPQTIEQTSLVWNTPLEAAPINKPTLLKNYKTGEKEIMIQDANHTIYLINKKGNIVWKRNIDKPILGEVKQMDYYRNGTLYYLFNTKSKVYLLDNQGKDALNYPIRLSSAAFAGLSMLQFGKGEAYNYFVPCGNKNLYGYEYSARPLNGWNPRKYLSLIEQPIQTFDHKGRRFLTLANSIGDLYMLDAEGKLIYKKALGSKPISAPEIDKRDGENKIVLTTKNGRTHFVNANGKHWSKLFVKGTVSDFLTANVLGSDLEENVFLANGQIYVFNQKQKLFAYTFPSGTLPSDIFEVSLSKENKSAVGVFCKKNKKAYLLENYGKFHPDFPMSASTPFVMTDLFKSGDDILIAGGLNNNLVAYRVR